MPFQRRGSAYSIGVGELGWQYGTGLKSHGTVTNGCTGRGWHVNCMTVISARWRSKHAIPKEWALNYYITQCTGNSTCFWRSVSWKQDAVEKASTRQKGPRDPRLRVWRPDQLETRCGRENQQLERLGPRASGWAAQENGKRNTDGYKRTGGSICCSSVPSPTPSHTQPFQINWEVYFTKRLCHSSLSLRLLLCVFMILYASICIWVYNTNVSIANFP